MSEFQPEDTMPDPDAAANGATPLEDKAAPPPPPPYGQAAPPLPSAAWNMAPPAWAPPPVKKRKAWPWVVGIVGGLVVLGGAATAIVLGVTGALNADQNDNYVGEPITASDAPAIGDQVLVSDDGTVAFDIGSEWIDGNTIADVSSMESELPQGASIMAAYFTFDPAAAVDVPPSFVVVIEGAGASQVGPVNVRANHEDFMAGAVKSLEGGGVTATTSEPDAVTSANGLDGFVSTISCDIQGIPVRSYIYTFARGKRVVFVQIFSYTTSFDDATAALVTDSLRMDK